MPTYMYKAVTRTGLVVKNKVESPSKQTLLKDLKSNDLIPIDIEQLKYSEKRKKQKRRIFQI